MSFGSNIFHAILQRSKMKYDILNDTCTTSKIHWWFLHRRNAFLKFRQLVNFTIFFHRLVRQMSNSVPHVCIHPFTVRLAVCTYILCFAILRTVPASTCQWVMLKMLDLCINDFFRWYNSDFAGKGIFSASKCVNPYAGPVKCV